MRKLVRRFWGGLILLVLVVAVCVQLGREAFPMLNDYREPIADFFSDRLGVEVEIGAIQARWVGLRPRLEFHDVSMRSVDGRDILSIGKAEGELSLVNSVRERQLVWRELEFSQLDMQFEQADNGRWSLGGLSLARRRSDDRLVVKDPLDIFLLARHLTLNASTFQFSFRTGHEAELSVPQLLIENEADFHRLAAHLAVDGDKEVFSVVIEGHGNPRAEDNFRVEGYVALENFPMEKVVAALDVAAWDAGSEGQWSEGHRLDTSLWFSGNPYRELELKGHLRADGLPLKAPESVRLPTGLRTLVTGIWQTEKGWQLGLQQAELTWDQVSSPSFNLRLAGAFNQPLKAAVDQIDLAAWHALAQQAGLIRGKLGEVLASLKPAGVLQNIRVEQRSAEQGYFRLRANLRDLQVEAWRGAPAIGALDGYLDTSALGGRVVVDSKDGFSMSYPLVYHKSLTYQRASGELRWALRKELKQVEVSSGRLSLSGEEGEGRGYIHLVLPYGKQPRPAPRMTLLVGLRDSQARFHEKYVPYKVPDALYEWLQSSIKGGAIDEAGFLWHGPLIRRMGASRPAIQLFGYANQAELEFSPEWPRLRQATGSLVLDNRELSVHVERGELEGNQLRQVAIEMQPTPGQPLSLRITGNAEGNLGDALGLLRKSPLGERLGGGFPSWRGQGQVEAKLDLTVPLQPDVTQGQYDVQVRLTDAQLQLPDLGLPLENITGPLHYTSDHGLNSPGLDFTLWGEKGSAALSSTLNPSAHLFIDFSSSASAKRVLEWLKQPQLAPLAEGSATVAGTVDIPFGEDGQAAGGVRVSIRSDLAGVAIALPAPYGKPALEARPLEVSATVDQSQHIKVAYGDLLRLQLARDERLTGASLAFGAAFEPIKPGFLDISGRVGSVDLPVWKSVLQRLETDSQPPHSLEQSGINAIGGTLIPRFDLYLDALQLEQYALEQLYLAGEYRYQRWRVDVRSPQLYGEIFAFNDGQPLQVNLDTLRLPLGTTPAETASAPDDAEGTSLLRGVDLSRLPAVNFSVASLTVADKDYGAWSFELRPITGGILVQNLKGKAMGLAFGGRKSIDQGADIVWLQSEGENSTYVNGRVTAQDLGEVLQEFGQTEILESESARFDLELHWPGTPDEVRLNSLEGSVTLDVRDGRFIRGAEAGNNPFLRLFGLLNFDTLARRLKLDFSDLLKEGMPFDSVVGTLRFSGGQVVVSEPLRVVSPSSTLHFAGVLDANTEQLDASLVATLPVTGNLTIAAAFVGGLPAALGVYAVGKLFKEQVDKVSSIRYHISGSWNDPSLRVDKIFESSTEADSQLLESSSDKTPGQNQDSVEHYRRLIEKSRAANTATSE